MDHYWAAAIHACNANVWHAEETRRHAQTTAELSHGVPQLVAATLVRACELSAALHRYTIGLIGSGVPAPAAWYIAATQNSHHLAELGPMMSDLCHPPAPDEDEHAAAARAQREAKAARALKLIDEQQEAMRHVIDTYAAALGRYPYYLVPEGGVAPYPAREAEEDYGHEYAAAHAEDDV